MQAFNFETPALSSAIMKAQLPSQNQMTNAQRQRQTLLCYIGLLSILLLVWPVDQLPVPISSQRFSAPAKNESDARSSVSAETEAAANVPRRLHRGKVMGANVGAAELAEAYRSIKSEYASLAMDPSSSAAHSWRLLSSHADGSEVSLLEHPTDPSCPYVRMTSIMPGSVRDVWDFLDLDNWEESMPNMDPFYEGVHVLSELRHGNIELKLARKTTSRIAAFGKRDFAFASVSDRPRDGMWASGTVSLETEEIPRERGYVRAYQDSVAFYEGAEEDKRTGRSRMRLTIVFRLDLNDSSAGGAGGYVPMWIYVRTVGATGMASVQNMKRQLRLKAEERERNVGRNKEGACDDNWLARIRNGTTKC